MKNSAVKVEWGSSQELSCDGRILFGRTIIAMYSSCLKQSVIWPKWGVEILSILPKQCNFNKPPLFKKLQFIKFLTKCKMIVRWQDKWHFFIVSSCHCVLFTVTGMNLWTCNYLWIVWLAEKGYNGLKLQHDLTMIKRSEISYCRILYPFV